jgi:hypothetical protein
MPDKSAPSPDDRDPLSVACELVGRFQYHFSKIETSINQGIAKLLNLNDIARDIVCANLDFVKKLNIIQTAIAYQFVDKDEAAVSALKQALGINDPHRQTVIHSTFEPFGNDGVRFQRVIAKRGVIDRRPQEWDKARFENFCKQMETLAPEIERLIENLKPYAPSLDFSDPRNSMYIGFM